MQTEVMEPTVSVARRWTKPPALADIVKRCQKGYDFNQKIGLYDTVEVNENFYIGDQWHGVEANGLPTPCFNMLKQIVNFSCATISSDNMVLKASPLPSTSGMTALELSKFTQIINDQFAAIMERNKIVTQSREYLRNAAVDGDACMYFYFDAAIENGQPTKGEIVSEIIDNQRVHFGNPNSRDIQSQPFIIITKRKLVEDVQYLAYQYHEAGFNDVNDVDVIKADSEKFRAEYDSFTDDKVTVMTYMYRNRDTKTIWCVEATEKCIIREAYDTGYSLYPIVWMSWDYKKDCYHGQALITGLIPNQKFVNKIFAMVGVSLITMAFPKIVYDRNRIAHWDARIGSAVGVNGSVSDVAQNINGASINPQIAQFIELCIEKTKSLLGASDVALGNSRPDNTSAIVALQRAASTPLELTKLNFHQSFEDMGLIWLDMMSVNYGIRNVEVMMQANEGEQPLGITLPDKPFVEQFDFDVFQTAKFSIKLDPGTSSFWSEMAAMQTLDNLLMNKVITGQQYIERMPSGYIPEKEALLEELRKAAAMAIPSDGGGGMPSTPSGSEELPVEGGPGNGALQRALNAEGA